MTKDKALEDLFLAQKPVFDDQDQFMQRLERKLETVEYIKQYEEANLRRYKYAMIAAFVMGLFSGGILLAVMLSTPLNEPLFTFGIASGILLEIQQNSRVIASLVLMLFMSLGVISIVNNIQDILRMKKTFMPQVGSIA